LLETTQVGSFGLIEIVAPTILPLGLRSDLSDEERLIQHHLEKHVRVLSHDIGPRHTRRPRKLEAAAQYIESEFRKLDVEINVLEYTTFDGHTVRNVEGIIPGSDSSSSLVIGAHYDSVEISRDLKEDCPGANDNASAAAALLEIGRMLVTLKARPRNKVRLMAFTNEEPPYFLTHDMGSRRHSNMLRSQREAVTGMICLETLGYYSDEPKSQMIPPPVDSFFNHDRGNFLVFMSDLLSGQFLKSVANQFANESDFPCVGLIADQGFVGLEMSDQVSFWQEGFKAIMVTDSVFMRTPRPHAHTTTYHTREDTWEKLNYVAMAQVTDGLTKVVHSLSTSPSA
jgi:Zn-dependent M28 family amino/carboxypeptidase